MIIEYDGSAFHGWQLQNNARSVQGEMEKAVFRLTGEKARVTGASRTDTGVHAYGQTVHFDTESKIPAGKFAVALNSWLPEEVAVISSEEADPGFHARFSSTGKTYEYRVLNRYNRSPILAKRTWLVREPLNVQNMRKAASYFIGNHDFTSFCASGHSTVTFDRTIFTSEWLEDGDCLVYRVHGNGFLYNMVRIMTGTMVEIGMNKRPADDIARLLEKKDRNQAGITAPPQGLYLMKVHYSEQPNFSRA